jgi:hypothetical protein
MPKTQRGHWAILQGSPGRSREAPDRIGSRKCLSRHGGSQENSGALYESIPYYDDYIEGLAEGVQRMYRRLVEVDDASMMRL